MEFEHMSAKVPGPGQYYPRKHYLNVDMKGVSEKYRKFPHYLTGPGKPKKEVKIKPLPKEQYKYPEQMKYKTFSKINMI